MHPVLISCRNKDQLYRVASDMISARLQEDINDHKTASLLLSGGSTPAPIYKHLSNTNLPWNLIQIAMVDDRWVGEQDDGSNAAMIRKTLLQNKAKLATFIAMKTDAASALLAQDTVETRYQAIFRPYSAVVLGMGVDGHTASWFASADGYKQAVNTQNHTLVSAVMAKPSTVTGKYLERMTITASALAQSKFAVLCLIGKEKKQIFEQALHTEQTRIIHKISHIGNNELPVQIAIRILGKKLTVLTCD